MILTAAQAGRNSVFQILGLQKEAKIFGPGWLGRFGHGLKRFMIGDPGRFMEEIRAGEVMAPGSSIRSIFKIPSFRKHPIQGPLTAGLIYGLPAHEAYQISQDPDPHKAQRIGGMLGGTALGWAAFGPVGMLGSIPAGMAGEWAGGQLGKGVGKLTGEGSAQALPPPSQRLMLHGHLPQMTRDRPLTDVSRWQQEY